MTLKSCEEGYPESRWRYEDQRRWREMNGRFKNKGKEIQRNELRKKLLGKSSFFKRSSRQVG